MTGTALRRAGNGRPLVLLHPLALSGAVWGRFAERLADHFDVLAPDARGHGDAAWDGAPFTTADLAADVVALLDGLGIERAHVLGMSMGGSIAVELAAAYPGRVDRLVVADGTAWYGADAPQVWAQRAERAVELPRPRQVPFQTDRWFTDGFVRTHHGEVRRVAGIFTATDSLAHAAACRALGALDVRDRLSAITAPTLSVTGEEDYATPPEMGAAIAANVADGVHRTVPGLRHLSLVERPDLAELVRAHLDGRPLPETGTADCGCPAEEIA